MKKTAIISVLVLLALGAGFGCPKNNARLNTQQRLLQRVAGYHDALGWRDWNAAAKFVAPESRAEFQAMAQRLDRGYTLDSWVVRDVKPDADGKTAVVVYRTFILSPSIMLQSESVPLKWAFITSDWFLEGPPF